MGHGVSWAGTCCHLGWMCLDLGGIRWTGHGWINGGTSAGGHAPPAVPAGASARHPTPHIVLPGRARAPASRSAARRRSARRRAHHRVWARGGGWARSAPPRHRSSTARTAPAQGPPAPGGVGGGGRAAASAHAQGAAAALRGKQRSWAAGSRCALTLRPPEPALQMPLARAPRHNPNNHAP